MSANFEHLAKYSVSTDAKPYTISYGDEAVTLHCTVAGEANKGWWNDAVRKSSAKAAAGAKKKPNAKLARVNDARSFAQHCVVGWDENPDDDAQNPMLDSEGKVVPFSKEAAEEFLVALARHVPYAFDEFRFWIINDRNFTGSAGDGGVALGN